MHVLQVYYKCNPCSVLYAPASHLRTSVCPPGRHRGRHQTRGERMRGVFVAQGVGAVRLHGLESDVLGHRDEQLDGDLESQEVALEEPADAVQRHEVVAVARDRVVELVHRA